MRLIANPFQNVKLYTVSSETESKKKYVNTHEPIEQNEIDSIQCEKEMLLVIAKIKWRFLDQAYFVDNST